MSASATRRRPPLTVCTPGRVTLAKAVLDWQDDDSMWARWLLAIGLGLVLLYVGVLHGLVRQDISRTSRTQEGVTEHVTGRQAVLAGWGICLAGLALVVLGVSTALSWRLSVAFYLLWLLAGLGVLIFFMAIRQPARSR